jgi:hypothetical protein
VRFNSVVITLDELTVANLFELQGKSFPCKSKRCLTQSSQKTISTEVNIIYLLWPPPGQLLDFPTCRELLQAYNRDGEET